MSFLPIVERELRVSARKRSTYWIRFGAAAIALLFTGWSLLTFTFIGAAPFAGKMLFGGLTAIAWLHAALGGAIKTADALSEEKREGTLGLLFLTDLKGYDVVLGKIVAASVNWFFGLLALFPILGISLLMGGVAPGEFWRKILALTNLLFFSLALGMLISSMSRNERRAALATLLFFVLLFTVPSELAEDNQRVTGAKTPSPVFVFPDVSRPLQYSNDYLYHRNPEFYWGSLFTSHLIGWVFLALASVITPRAWQQQAGTRSRWQERAEQAAYGRNPSRRARFRRHALDINPFFWLAGRARGKVLNVYAIIALLFGWVLFDIVTSPKDWDPPTTFLWPVFVSALLLKIWLAFEACRRFIDDRRSGALELLLSTPLTVENILAGQWRALRRQFLGPTVAVLLFDALLFCLAVQTRVSSGTQLRTFITMMSVCVIAFLLDMFALGWVSMWAGMKARHSYGALLRTVVQVLVAPWVIFYIAFTGGMVAFATARSGIAMMPKWISTIGDLWELILPALWLVISAAVALLSAAFARRNLTRHFRYQATLSYQPPKPRGLPKMKPGNIPPRTDANAVVR